MGYLNIIFRFKFAISSVFSVSLCTTLIVGALGIPLYTHNLSQYTCENISWVLMKNRTVLLLMSFILLVFNVILLSIPYTYI